MTDEVFSPAPAPQSVSVPGSAEVLYLRAALFVLRGVHHDPIVGEQRPLPPHRWVLVHGESVFSEGTTSDDDGISTIFAPAVPEDLAEDARWELWLVPIYPGRDDSDPYAEEGEAWIDVEERTWATGEAVRDGDAWRVTTRKLLRIPFWTSTRQATHGELEGGPPSAADWEETGTLATSELLPFGTRDEPWEIAIDHGWLRTHVQLRYYDFAAREERPIPQGVVLRAVDERTGRTTGASSVRLEDGAIYVLHEHSVETAEEGLQYRFETPATSVFELETGTVEVIERFELEALATHYVLPRLWCSRGMEAWTGDRDASADVREPFSDLRTSGQDAGDPVCFHLDDAVLVDTRRRPITVQEERICILDSQLAIRDQASSGGKPVPWSEPTVTAPLLRAETFVFARGEGIEKLSRAFDHGGWIFALDLDRVPVPGEDIINPFASDDDDEERPLADQMTGARAARMLDTLGPFPTSPFAARRLTVHLVDTRYLTVPVGDASPKLAHILIYQGFYLDMRTPGSTGRAEVEQGAFMSSQVWDQTHPAHTQHVERGGDRKDYAIVARDTPITDGSTALKLRHHFGLRTSIDRLPVTSSAPADQHSHIIVDQQGRASMGNDMKIFLQRTGQTSPAAAPFAFGPTNPAMKDRVDDVRERRFTLAHELGHAFGLPDEYRERWRPATNLDGRLTRFRQGRRKPQFALDEVSAMIGNRLPRLRYAWPFARWLAAQAGTRPAEDWLHGLLPCDVHYQAGGRTLRYRVADGVDLWEPVHSGAQQQVQLALYALGDDESSRGPMFTNPPHVFDTPFDGVVVVSCNLWFDFEDSVSGLSRRWELMVGFGETYETRASIPRFFIEAPAGATEYRRVAILVVPRFQFGPQPSSTAAAEALAQAHVRVVVFGGSNAAPTKDLTTSPPRLRIHRSAVSHAIVRFALDPATQPTGNLTAPLSAADLAPVNVWLATQLGRAAGTLRAYP